MGLCVWCQIGAQSNSTGNGNGHACINVSFGCLWCGVRSILGLTCALGVHSALFFHFNIFFRFGSRVPTLLSAVRPAPVLGLLVSTATTKNKSPAFPSPFGFPFSVSTSSFASSAVHFRFRLLRFASVFFACLRSCAAFA